MAEHTPGPWTLNKMCTPRGGWVYADDPSNPGGELRLICTTAYQPHDDEAQYANARLIARAPDLLAVCEAAKALLQAAGIEGGAPQALAAGSEGFMAHADQIAAAWRDLKAAVARAQPNGD